MLYRRLSEIYWAKYDFVTPCKFAEECCALSAKAFGESSDTNISAMQLGVRAFSAAGRDDAAGEFLRKIETQSLKVFGEHSIRTVFAILEVAKHLPKLGKVDEAIAKAEHALGLIKKYAQSDHMVIRSALSVMAISLDAKGDTAAAREHFLKVVDLSEGDVGMSVTRISQSEDI